MVSSTSLVNIPNDRGDFIEYCLRRLGKPVIEINVSYEQASDRVNDALLFWWDYHFEGTFHAYYKYQLTQADLTNGYITLPQNIIGAVNFFDTGSILGGDSNPFNIRYQIALNDLYTLTSVSMVPYYMAFQHLQLLEQILIGRQPIRYNRYDNNFYFDTNLNNLFNAGDFVVVDAYQIVDPSVYSSVWSDRFLQRYATTLIKRQWGENLKKFVGMEMPGGVKFNGQKMYDEAIDEIKQIEDEVIRTYSMPVTDFIG
jgi:hypothetical protein